MKSNDPARGDVQWLLRIVSGAVLNAAHAHPDQLPDRRFAQSVAKRCVGTLTAAMPMLVSGVAPKVTTIVFRKRRRKRDKATPGSFSDICRQLGERIMSARLAGDLEMETALRQAVTALAPLARRDKAKAAASDEATRST